MGSAVRLGSWIAAGCLAVAGAVFAAPSASATPYTLTLTMNDTTCVVTAPAVQTLQSGDQVTVVNSAGMVSPCQLIVEGSANLVGWTKAIGGGSPISLATVSSDFVPMGMNHSVTYVVGTQSADIFTKLGPTAVSTVATFTSGGGGGGGGSAPSGGGGIGGPLPAPVVQEFGKPAEVTCDAAAPEGLNWAGVPSGGWGVTWAQWLNEGKGGAVCSRTLAYSSNLGTWHVR